jgi:hypothetical protein
MDQHHWILGTYFYDIFSYLSQTSPLYYDVLSHSSRMNKPFVTFYKIYRGWRTNSPVSIGPPLVFCLPDMNKSCWSHMSDLHRKTFFGYQNIILCHLSGPHASSAWTDFFKWNSKCWKQGLNPQPHGHWKHISLGYCFIFVVVQVIISLYYPLCIDSVQSAW